MTQRSISTGAYHRAFSRPQRKSNPLWRNTAWIRGGFAFVAALSDLVAIIISAAVVKTLTSMPFDGIGQTRSATFALLVTIVFLISNVTRGEYAYERYLTYTNQLNRCLSHWVIAQFCAFAIEFSTQKIGELSRLAVFSFLIIGFANILLGRQLLVSFLRAKAASGSITARRVFLVGFEPEMDSFYARYQPASLGMRVVTASVLRGPETLQEDLALAAASARILRPDDVFILAPWSQKETIDSCINAFLRVPAAIHLGPERILDRFTHARIARIGPVASLNLERPLSHANVILKRVFDIAVASAGLVFLSPLLAATALAIKLDSPGPVIFKQRRYGFNQEPFRILKFRTMSTLDDGRKIEQAKINDSRVTRIGRFLRQTNIDELPQLVNVLRGEMSLVGPRPHAMAHDQLFERSVTLYGRRHNVKPGITGWAQVNGLRGGINAENLKARVEHDLYYIDNWSLWLDLQIIWRTFFSLKAYTNAY